MGGITVISATSTTNRLRHIRWLSFCTWVYRIRLDIFAVWIGDRCRRSPRFFLLAYSFLYKLIHSLVLLYKTV